MPKDKLLRIINNNERDKNSLYKPTRNSTFKLKREKIKKSLYR